MVLRQGEQLISSLRLVFMTLKVKGEDRLWCFLTQGSAWGRWTTSKAFCLCHRWQHWKQWPLSHSETGFLLLALKLHLLRWASILFGSNTVLYPFRLNAYGEVHKPSSFWILPGYISEPIWLFILYIPQWRGHILKFSSNLPLCHTDFFFFS